MSGRAGSSAVRVALVPWGTPLEAFLDPLGRTLDDFCERLDGGWLFGCAEALRREGHLPSLVVSSRQVARATPRVHVPTGTPVTVLPAPRSSPHGGQGLRRDVAAYRSALPPGLLRTLAQADVVLLQEYEEPRADLLAWWSVLRRVPVVASFQGGAPPWHAAPVQRLVRGPALRRLAGLLVGPEEEAERVVSARGADPARVHRVANPVDVAAWAPGDRAAARSGLGLPREAFVVAWHGRVDVRRKGLDVLLDAWRDLCARRPDAPLHLLLVGGGADEPELASRLDARGLRGVAWHAQYASAQDVRRRLAACDLWVSASRHEGFAVAPLEAMASGRPVVLSDAPGAAAAIGTEGRHGGVLVPRADAPALAAALLDALDRPGALEARGRSARRRVEQEFSLEAVGRQLTAALLAARRGVRVAAEAERSR